MIGEEDIVEIGIVGLEVEGAILVAEGEGMIETEMTIVAVGKCFTINNDGGTMPCFEYL